MPRKNILNCGGIFDLSAKQADLEKMRQASTTPDFWNDNVAASSLLKKISILEKEIKLWENLDRAQGDVGVLLEFAEAGESSLKEVD